MDIYERSGRFFGEERMKRLGEIRVLLFGVGGVGSWCAEALVRTGVTHLTMVDPDVVCASNVNRQLMATSQNVGRPKVLELRDRLLAINPNAEIEALQKAYTAETAADFDFEDYDFVIDAIDSLADKLHLILQCVRAQRPRLFSSMGAALKFDSSRVNVAEFWKVKGCPLARALRQKMKAAGTYPARKFQCVYSDEARPEGVTPCADGNGSLVHVTAVFGMRLAELVLKNATAD